ncbi:MAG: hypothetical protein JWP27_3080 [Flaviaesturariibacter sp.]|nr:hypothetical protein [Flaviaesturariibacter sp.]
MTWTMAARWTFDACLGQPVVRRLLVLGVGLPGPEPTVSCPGSHSLRAAPLFLDGKLP